MLVDLRLNRVQNPYYAIVVDEYSPQQQLLIITDKGGLNYHNLTPYEQMISKYGNQNFGGSLLQFHIDDMIYKVQDKFRLVLESKGDALTKAEKGKTEFFATIPPRNAAAFEARRQQRQIVVDYVLEKGTEEQKALFKTLIDWSIKYKSIQENQSDTDSN